MNRKPRFSKYELEMRRKAVFEHAVELFEGDRDAAEKWMQHPARALGGVAPFDHMCNLAGIVQVDDLIGRLEHGVYT